MPRPPRNQVLIVEDEPAIRELVEVVLQDDGFRVEAVPDGQRALELVDDGGRGAARYCVILLDLMLPGAPGLEILRYVQAQPAPPPVVVMSASRDHLAEAIRLGAHLAIAKPFDLGEVIGIVEGLCPRAREGA